MNKYISLKNQYYEINNAYIIPIREEDKYLIMQWRNEQLYHLRQNKLLTKDDQDKYFSEVINPSFFELTPKQILFSFIKDNECIGYGGLVHISWKNRNAEISFIMKTELENENFEILWITYLNLIEKVAFEDLGLHKIFTYAFDLRPRLYKALLYCKFNEEARLREQVKFDNKYIDVVIHSKIKSEIYYRKALPSDVKTYYEWINETSVREHSFNSERISWESHVQWFNEKINDPNYNFYIFYDSNENLIGQVRIQLISKNNSLIGVSVDQKYRGQGYGSKIIEYACSAYLKNNPNMIIHAYIKQENIKSKNIFEKSGFEFIENIDYNNFKSYHYIFYENK
jgi:RimJ/RimL family protein N-acetyltransferase